MNFLVTSDKRQVTSRKFGAAGAVPIFKTRHSSLITHHLVGTDRWAVRFAPTHQIANRQSPIANRKKPAPYPRVRAGARNWQRHLAAFTLVEILVVLALLSLIIFALMAVFASTQRAFRASITQGDSLEGGRAVMDLMASDLEGMTPVDWQTNYNYSIYSPLNFAVLVANYASPPSPLIQPLIGSVSGALRTNVLENIFMMDYGNINGTLCWIGTGYSVNTNLPDGTLYPLYRFYMTSPASAGAAGETALFTTWYNSLIASQYTNTLIWSHLMDGVVHLTVRAYDTNGIWMTNGYAFPANVPVKWCRFQDSGYGEPNCWFYSNALPASVEFELGTLEDQTLQHAQTLSGVAQSNYLAGAAAQVHLFRQRVWIRNLDPTAYQ